ncbi:hypothetical protein [Micromonospora marina]|uniref:hypothetical protein n=1 Tax=Micromonospora marina TaxID=307120 RepID=UPI003451DB2D
MPATAPWRRVVAVPVVAVLLGAFAATGLGIASAETSRLTGRPIPADQLPSIQAAALSCPALTPARLAGQIMAASAFDRNAHTADGGAGVAGLTAAQWSRWRPSADARRADARPNIVALAHQMCDLVGQVRAAGVGGEPWRLALAAYRSGVAAVRSARGIPTAATRYVEQVARFSAWYAGRPEFAITPSARPTRANPATPRPIPAEYLPLVRSAGRVCAAISPARIAAQLMAASAFNPNMLSPDGAQGIAGFTPQIWASYAPRPALTSPWEPTTAIPALGHAMCGLSGDLAGLATDVYPLALAAFAWGPEPVKQAGGLPAVAGLRGYVDTVRRFAEYYAHDPDLAGRAAVVTPDASRSGAPEPPVRPGAKTRNDAPQRTAVPRPDVKTTRGTSPPERHWQTRVVRGTSVLRRGESWSTNRLRLSLRTDGEVILSDQGRVVWRAGTTGRGGATLVFQGDGNLALYNAAGAGIWSTSTEGNDEAILVLQADGNVTISVNGRFLWHTGTPD